MKNRKTKVILDYTPDNVAEKCVEISEFQITYSQPADTNSHSDDIQELTVKALNNGMGEDGWYYDISTGTHWSIDNPDEIGDIIRDFKSRMYMNTHKVDTLKRL